MDQSQHLSDMFYYLTQKSKAAQQKAAGIANEQKFSVQEVIKAGHLCIFSPKFHYELNFIELF